MIVPTVRCRAIGRAVDFYTRVLDFELRGAWPQEGDPAFAVLERQGGELHLSSHAGDGVFGQAVAVLVDDVDALFARLAARGLSGAHKPQSPVHQAPVEQTWGSREVYADDPDGNTIRFIQRL